MANQPSKSSPVNSRFFGPIAARYMGMWSRTGCTVRVSALPGPSGSGSVKNSPSYCNRSRRSALRTISVYSRVRASGRSNFTPCQPSADLRAGNPEPEPEAAAGEGVQGGGGHGAVRGRAARDLEHRSCRCRSARSAPRSRPAPWPHRSRTLQRPKPPNIRVCRPRGPVPDYPRRCRRPNTRDSHQVAWFESLARTRAHPGNQPVRGTSRRNRPSVAGIVGEVSRGVRRAGVRCGRCPVDASDTVCSWRSDRSGAAGCG